MREFNIGDRVTLTDMYGYKHEMLVKEVFNLNNDNIWLYSLTYPKKDGSIPKRYIRGKHYQAAHRIKLTPLN